MKLISGADRFLCDMSAPTKTAQKHGKTLSLDNCLLCRGVELQTLSPKNDERHYYLCHACKLIAVDPIYYLSEEDEKKRYQSHNNGIDEPGYVSFLNRIVEPALSYINKSMKGLDFGCGPAPTLSKLVNSHGITCDDYDPLFHFNTPLNKYDFIFATECFEHFFEPKKELKKIKSLLKPGGYLFVMTERYDNIERFHNWYYKRDPTHVIFFHQDTFHFIENEYGFKIMYNDKNRVIILKKLD